MALMGFYALSTSSFSDTVLWLVVDAEPGRDDCRLRTRADDLRRHVHPGRPQDLGGGADAQRPERRGSFRSAADLRRRLQVHVQGSHRSVEREQGDLLPGADGDGRARLRRLGRRADGRSLGGRRHQCRHPLSLRGVVARRLRHHHGRLGVELEIPVPLRAACRSPDGLLRGLHRLRDRDGAAVRRLAEPLGHRARAGAWLVRLHDPVSDAA